MSKLELPVATDRPPRLALASAPGGLVRVSLDDAPLLWAREAAGAWCWLRSATPVPSLVPPLSRALVRGLARRGPESEHWWRGWMEALGPSLAALTGRGARILLVPAAVTMERGVRIPSRLERAPFEGGWGESTSVLPLHPWPAPDDRAVRRAAQQLGEGIAAPIVLRWLPRLDALLLVDGHARLVAAAERTPPALVALPVERGSHGAVTRELARLRGGARRWRDEVTAAGGALSEMLLAPEVTRRATSSYR